MQSPIQLELTNPNAIWLATYEEYERVKGIKLVVTVPTAAEPGKDHVPAAWARFSTIMPKSLWTEMAINDDWRFSLEKHHLVSPDGDYMIKVIPDPVHKQDIASIELELKNAKPA